MSSKEIKAASLLMPPSLQFPLLCAQHQGSAFHKTQLFVKMSTPSLAAAWSLDTTFPEGDDVRPAILNSTSSSEVASWTVTTYCCSRWAIYFLSHVIKSIPSTEVRLRNEAFIPYYKALCDATAGLIEISQQNQISLPLFPDPLPDYELEASDIRRDTLGATLLTQVALPIKPLLDTMGDLMRRGHGYHWGSLAAFIGVPSDVYFNAVNATKESKSTPGKRTIAPFVEPLTSENMLQTWKVMREELVRCREEAPRTGWKDEEARGLTQEFVNYFEKFSSMGL